MLREQRQSAHKISACVLRAQFARSQSQSLVCFVEQNTMPCWQLSIASCSLFLSLCAWFCGFVCASARHCAQWSTTRVTPTLAKSHDLLLLSNCLLVGCFRFACTASSSSLGARSAFASLLSQWQFGNNTQCRAAGASKRRMCALLFVLLLLNDCQFPEYKNHRIDSCDVLRTTCLVKQGVRQ